MLAMAQVIIIDRDASNAPVNSMIRTTAVSGTHVNSGSLAPQQQSRRYSADTAEEFYRYDAPPPNSGAARQNIFHLWNATAMSFGGIEIISTQVQKPNFPSVMARLRD
jgi:hypothetical protein